MDWGNRVGNLVIAAVIIALVALVLWVSMDLTPWLDGLPFSPWWLLVPVAVVTVGLVLLLKPDYWDLENFVYGLLGGVILLAVVAGYIGLVDWRTSWLDALPYSPWLLLVPVALIALILAVLTGWSEWWAILLFILIGILLIPPAIATAPVWGPGYYLVNRYDQRRKRREREQRRGEAEENLGSVLEQFSDTDQTQRDQARKLFEEKVWPNLGVLPSDELTDAFRQFTQASPSWGMGQVLRALSWYGAQEEYEAPAEEEYEKVRNASRTVLGERLLQPDTLFTELAQLLSRPNWSLGIAFQALGSVSQESGQKALADVCLVYLLLQSAPDLCLPPHLQSLLQALGEHDWSLMEDWLSEIFPGWPGWESVSSELSEYWWEPLEAAESSESLVDIKILSERERATTILDIAIRGLQKVVELPHGRERYLTYKLIRDLEQIRFERDMIAVAERKSELFDLEDDLLHAQVVDNLRDLVKVCGLLQRSERPGLLVTERLAFYASALGVLQLVLKRSESETLPPDGWFLHRIAEGWLKLITDGIARMKAKAKLEVELADVEAAGRDYAVSFQLHNRASGLAERVRILFDPEQHLAAKGIRLVEGLDELDYIQGGRPVLVRLRLSVENPGTYQLPLSIEYDDLEKEDQVLQAVCEASFAVSERSFIPLVPNPYIAGPPLRSSEMFFGREEIFRFVEEHLPAGSQENLIVLHGERRTGKTSILYQLQHRLPEPYLPMLVDLQGASSRTMPDFWYYLARRMFRSLRRAGFSIEKPRREAFEQDPVDCFADEFLPQVYDAVGDKRPVLLIDEFDVLVSEVRKESLNEVVLENLRNVMQHTTLGFIFAGTYDIEKLGEQKKSVLFNTPHWQRIELLDRPTCEALVKGPVNFAYDPAAMEKIWEITSGHPYFVQLLCHQLVNYRNDNRLNYLTVQDVKNVIKDVAGFGQIHLGYMWDGLETEKKAFLIVITKLLETKGIAIRDDIRAELAGYGITLEFEEAIKELTAKAILKERNGRYEFPIGLVRTWIYKTKSLASLL